MEASAARRRQQEQDSSGSGEGVEQAVYDIVARLACVAQSFGAGMEGGSNGAGGDGGGGGGGGSARALQKQLRRLRAEARKALAGETGAGERDDLTAQHPVVAGA